MHRGAVVEPLETFAFRDRAVFIAATETLVLSDLHLGMAARSTVQSGLGEHDALTTRFRALLEEFEPREAVIAGDLLHSFSSLPRGVMETLQQLEDDARAADTDMTVTPGNHDTMLPGLWDGPSDPEYQVGDWTILHGHDVPDGDGSGYIVGHDHPAIVVEGRRYPCFLYGEAVWDGSDVLMLPAFTHLAAGVVVNGMRGTEFQSPLIEATNPLHPIIRDRDGEETLSFPPLGEFRRLL